MLTLGQYGLVKRIEHFWKGLSAPRTQISPIPPVAYGDRFLNFVTGVTMTQEEADRRRTEESQRTGGQAVSMSLDNPGRSSTGGIGNARDGQDESTLSPTLSPEVERTMRKAQKQTDKATPSEKGRSGSEEEKPDRTLKTTEEVRSNTLLPVVQEAGEGGEPGDRQASREGEKHAGNHRDAPPPSVSRMSSIPGLRRVSPSTVGTATDFGDDTSVSSPQLADFEPEILGDYDDDETKPDHVLNREYDKAPRIASDLLQPQSPLGDTVFKSLDENIQAPR